MGEEEPQRIEPKYDNYAAWLEGFAVPHYTRKGARWEADWYNYPEVVSVVQSLWQAWEHFRAESSPTSMAVYFRDYFWPMMDRITQEAGPFYPASDPLAATKTVKPTLDAGDWDPAWFTPLQTNDDEEIY